MAWSNDVTETLVNAVTSATTGSAVQFRPGRTVNSVRYFIKSTSSTTATVDIQVSYDGTNWAAAISQVSNPGTGVTTGVISGPVPYIRAVTAGASHGTITVTAVAQVEA